MNLSSKSRIRKFIQNKRFKAFSVGFLGFLLIINTAFIGIMMLMAFAFMAMPISLFLTACANIYLLSNYLQKRYLLKKIRWCVLWSTVAGVIWIITSAVNEMHLHFSGVEVLYEVNFYLRFISFLGPSLSWVGYFIYGLLMESKGLTRHPPPYPQEVYEHLVTDIMLQGIFWSIVMNLIVFIITQALCLSNSHTKK